MDKTQLKFHHRLLHCHKIINCHTTGQCLPYLLHRMTRPTTALGQQRYQETVVDHSQLKFQFKLHHRLLHCHLQLLPCFRAALCESVVMDKTQLKFHHRLLHCHKIINCHTTGLCLPYLLHQMTRPTTALGQQKYQETVVDHSQLKFQLKFHHRLLHCQLQLLPCFRVALC